MNIVIVDYGMGNIRSIVGALKYIGVNDVSLSADYSVIKKADKLILPGVGSFGKAMANIRAGSLDSYLRERVLEFKTPILGICLGMQLLGISSTEEGYNAGLGFINGDVQKFNNSPGLKIPHVGFNQVRVNSNSRLYHNLGDNLDFYFTHSFKMSSSHDIGQSMCEYDGDFIAGFENDNIAGVQFHPELSQFNGLNLLKNFVKLF